MIDFDKLIHNHVKREEKPKVIGRYYPSEIGSCLRKIWFSYKYPKETESELLKIFKIGDMLHNFVVEVIKSEKNPDVELIDAEMPFELKMKNFVISGRVDDIVLLKANNKNILVEVKSISNVNKLEKAKPQHVMQLQLYMFATKIRDGMLLYVDKRNLKSKVFTIPYDEIEAIKALERFSILHEHLSNNTIPEPEAKLDEEKSWMCKYCEYRDLCEEADINGKKDR
ncbi:MAG: PD-(D/E)XK nuclease family protein [Nanoarchaeota archaeon]|nr:PD-(D/E)XK nuclease family protein [Nanoarchaeota archaeon]